MVSINVQTESPRLNGIRFTEHLDAIEVETTAWLVAAVLAVGPHDLVGVVEEKRRVTCDFFDTILGEIQVQRCDLLQKLLFFGRRSGHHRLTEQAIDVSLSSGQQTKTSRGW